MGFFHGPDDFIPAGDIFLFQFYRYNSRLMKSILRLHLQLGKSAGCKKFSELLGHHFFMDCIAFSK